MLVLILGNSGTGKSTSLRNFKKDELVYVQCMKKLLPFKNDIEINYSINPGEIIKFIEKGEKENKPIIIDDFFYIMSNKFFNDINEEGWDKYNVLALGVQKILDKASSSNSLVYVLSHLEERMNGSTKFKTIGKMIDNKLNIEGMATITLNSFRGQDGKYYFQTQSKYGFDTAKSPIGMFDEEIENDLKKVHNTIVKYYKLNHEK